MIRRKLWLALLVFVPVVAYAAVPSDPPPTFGTNTEDTAAHRWASNQPRHWRQVVVHR